MRRAARQRPGHAHEAQPLPCLLRAPIAQQQQRQRQAGAQQRDQRFGRHAQARQHALQRDGAEDFAHAVFAHQRNHGHARGDQADAQRHVDQHAGPFGPQGIDGVDERPPGQHRPHGPRGFPGKRGPGRRDGQHAQHQRHGLRALIHQADRRTDQRHDPWHERYDQAERGWPIPPEQQPDRCGHRQRGIEQQGQPGNMGVTHGVGLANACRNDVAKSANTCNLFTDAA